MITRRRLFVYHVIGMIAFVGTLATVSPALATLPAAFFLVYLAMLAGLYFLGWMAGTRRQPVWLHLSALVLGVAVLWIGMTAIGGPDAGVAALALSIVSLWPRRSA